MGEFCVCIHRRGSRRKLSPFFLHFRKLSLDIFWNMQIAFGRSHGAQLRKWIQGSLGFSDSTRRESRYSQSLFQHQSSF